MVEVKKAKKQKIVEQVKESDGYAWNLKYLQHDVERFEVVVGCAQHLRKNVFMEAFTNLLPTEKAIKAEMDRLQKNDDGEQQEDQSSSQGDAVECAESKAV